MELACLYCRLSYSRDMNATTATAVACCFSSCVTMYGIIVIIDSDLLFITYSNMVREKDITACRLARVVTDNNTLYNVVQ